MKNVLFLSLLGLLMSLYSCDYIGDKTPSLDTAEAQFISEVQIMSEQDALSKEISWYKEYLGTKPLRLLNAPYHGN